jgi:hypothetical protein
LNGLKSGKDKSLPWVVVHSVGFETPIRADLHRALSRLPAIHPTKSAILRGPRMPLAPLSGPYSSHLP